MRSTLAETETEVSSANLISHLRHEMRERDLKVKSAKSTSSAAMPKTPALLRHASHPDAERKANVQVLVAQHRSKKSNKYHIVEMAQQRWAERVDELKDAPILAVETRDDVLEYIREARLGEPESWRRTVQRAPLAERQYITQIQEWLLEQRNKWNNDEVSRETCLFNFRTGHCIYYDVGL